MSKNAVAKVEKTSHLTLVGGIDLEQFAGGGMQEMKAEDMSIPFLRILAQLSPQVNKRDGAYVQGAEAGDIYHTVENRAFKGDEGVTVVPCYLSHRYVEWKPREKGGGYVASYHAEDPIVKTTRRDDRGNDVLPNGNMLVNTYQYFVLLITSDGPQRCMIAMSSSQVTRAKKWNTTMQAQTARGSKGLFTLPMYTFTYKLKTTQQQNDKGSWYGWDITKEDQVDAETFQLAHDFMLAVRAGDVKVREDDGSEHTASSSSTAREDEVL